MITLFKNSPYQKWHIYTGNDEWSPCGKQYFYPTSDTWEVDFDKINQDNLCKNCYKSYLKGL